jgi:DNA-directed RNA polymerase subunit RPC12/RpoP
MSAAQQIVDRLLTEKKKRLRDQPVKVYVDRSGGRPIYRRKCPQCNRTYGRFNTRLDAAMDDRCPRCEFKAFEKLKKEYSGPKK